MTIKDIKKRLDEIEITSEGAKKINKFKEEIEQYRADVIKKYQLMKESQILLLDVYKMILLV
ncbi:MAG: hypothetical protein ACE1S7_05210 [Candidatus Tisiphia sp.]